MKSERKITIMLPNELIDRAIQASGEGLTPTIRKGLELIAAKSTYAFVSSLKGKYKTKGVGISLSKLREDRD